MPLWTHTVLFFNLILVVHPASFLDWTYQIFILFLLLIIIILI